VQKKPDANWIVSESLIHTNVIVSTGNKSHMEVVWSDIREVDHLLI